MATQLPTYSISLNAFEGGVLMGMIEGAEERIKPSLSGVRSQLIAMKRDIDNGMLENRPVTTQKCSSCGEFLLPELSFTYKFCPKCGEKFEK